MRKESTDKLFTIIMEYRGGTYIEQIHAADINLAYHKWIRRIVKPGKALSTVKNQKAIFESWNCDVPVRLSGLKNAWCTTLLVEDTSAQINIIKTVES